MSYSLSFSESFFVPDIPFDEIEPSDEPTTVLQAVMGLDRESRILIARDVLGSAGAAEWYADQDEFIWDVMDKIRETDTCDDLSSPITVYIDSDGFYSVTVYED